MSERKKITAAEMSRIMSEWDTDDDDLSDEESVDIPDIALHPPSADMSPVSGDDSANESSDDTFPSSSSRVSQSSVSQIGRDGTEWKPISSCVSVAGKRSSHNIFTASSGCRPSVQAAVSSSLRRLEGVY